VTPTEFTLVQFDATAIAAVVDDLLARLDLAARAVRLDVDETTPVVRIEVDSNDPFHLRAGSGALEDLRRPRQQSETSIATNVGRVLLRSRDRDDGSFAAAPPDDGLTLAQLAAWDAYSVGRLGRLGCRVHEPRWRYNFRNRHGFTDTADAAFDELWSAERLTWAAVETLSARATVEAVA
jgi:hypothetical protein